MKTYKATMKTNASIEKAMKSLNRKVGTISKGIAERSAKAREAAKERHQKWLKLCAQQPTAK